MKKVLLAILGALVITAASCLALTLMKGLPTREQLIVNGTQMFTIAFLVLLFTVGKKKAS